MLDYAHAGGSTPAERGIQPDTLACDFCNGPASWLYRARPVLGRDAGFVVAWERSSWRACEACRALIASGRRDALADAGVRANVAARPSAASRQQRRADERGYRRSVRRLQDGFWAARHDARPVPIATAWTEAQPGFVAALARRPAS